jgi:DNA-directed RNA polymerase subunit RPC12/RpoP
MPRCTSCMEGVKSTALTKVGDSVVCPLCLPALVVKRKPTKDLISVKIVDSAYDTRSRYSVAFCMDVRGVRIGGEYSFEQLRKFFSRGAA